MMEPLKIRVHDAVIVNDHVEVKPGSAILQATGYSVIIAEPKSRIIKPEGIPSGESIDTPTIDKPSPPEGVWFAFFSLCIPPMIGEPWIGDVRQRRIKMRADGYSWLAVNVATAGEFLCLLFYLGWGLLREAVKEAAGKLGRPGG